MDSIRGKVSGAGRIVLPAELRKAFGIEDGSEVIFSRDEYGIRVTTMDKAIEQAQAMVRQYVPEGTSLVEALREERSRDAARD